MRFKAAFQIDSGPAVQGRVRASEDIYELGHILIFYAETAICAVGRMPFVVLMR